MDYNEFVDKKIEGSELKRVGDIKKRKQVFYLECPKGHRKKMTIDTIYVKKIFDCYECRRIQNFEELKNSLESEGYTMLDNLKNFKNVASKIQTRCPKGHLWKCTHHRFINEGKRCSTCSKNQTLDSGFVKNEIEKYGYKIYNADEYKNAQTKLIIECPNGHITNTMTYANWRKGYRCYECLETKKKIFLL